MSQRKPVSREEFDGLLVHGYVRENTKYMSGPMPTDIVQLCLLWYHLRRDEWSRELTNDSITIDVENYLIKDDRDPQAHWSWRHAFGTDVVSRTANGLTKKTWKIKVLDADKQRTEHTGHVLFGIVNADKHEDDFGGKSFTYDHCDGYGLYNNGSVYYNGKAISCFKKVRFFKNKTVVRIDVDVSESELKDARGHKPGNGILQFECNGQKGEPIEIGAATAWRLVIGFDALNASVQLLE